MKLLSYLSAGILCLVLLSFKTPPPSGSAALLLGEALAKGWIKLNVSGTGGHSGSCLEAKIINLSGKKLSLRIEPGIVFKPDDPGMQDILVVKEQVIEIDGKAGKKINLTGFCCISHNRSPAKGTNFKMSGKTDPKLIELAKYLNKGNYETDAMQNAVWSISDQQSVSEIYDENPEKVKPLRQEVCRLTGQTDNWFNRQVERHVNNEGYIESEPTKVEGRLIFNIDKPTAVYQTVYKENGEVAWDPGKAIDISFTGEISMKFTVTVKGWSKGKYYIKITRPGKELLKQEFTV